MATIFNDMSDMDPARINHVVDSLDKAFDDDRSGTVGNSEHVLSNSMNEHKQCDAFQ
jgi:hypothetical protein